MSASGEVDEEWQAFIAAQRAAELDASSRRKASSPRRPARSSTRRSATARSRPTGTAITKVLPPASRFSADGGHGEKKQRVLAKLGEFFERFFGLS